MLRTFSARLLVSSLVALAAMPIFAACKESGGGTSAEGGSAKRLTCKMNGQCFICPSEAEIKKCIINPITSGCTKASDGECR
jgi:hypothetical protein